MADIGRHRGQSASFSFFPLRAAVVAIEGKKENCAKGEREGGFFFVSESLVNPPSQNRI